MHLSNLTWPHAEDYFRTHDTVLIGVGSIECHGRHMPLGTDTLIPDFLIDQIETKSDVLICPTIPYGAAESLCDYPGTVDLGTELLYQVLSRICDCLFQHGARRFVILNGHGGNNKVIDRVGYDIQRKGGILAELNWWLMAWDMDPAWKGGHGGGEETAAILGIDPSLVDRSEVPGPMKLHDVYALSQSHLHEYKGVTVNIPRLTPSVTHTAGSGPTTRRPPPRSGAGKCSRPPPTTSPTSSRRSRRWTSPRPAERNFDLSEMVVESMDKTRSVELCAALSNAKGAPGLRTRSSL